MSWFPRAHRLWLLVIVAAVLAVYANSCGGAFHSDDIPGLTKNPDIQRIDTSLRAFSDDRQSPLSGRPLVSLTFALNYAVGELDPWGYHAVNVGVHLLNAFVLFILVRVVLSNPRRCETFGDMATHIAGATALIWALHPLHTETVDYLVQRTELLVAFFYFTGFVCAAAGRPSPHSHRWSIATVLCAFLGALCKEVIVSLPLVILFYDALFVAGGVVAALRRRPVMYLGLFASWVLLGAIIAGGPRSASVGFAHNISAWQYLLTQAGVLVLYLRLSLWPATLSISYADWPIADSLGDAIVPGMFVVILLGLCLFALTRRSALGFLGVTCFLILAPTSSFVPIATEVVAERRMYLPLAAIALMLVVTVHHLLKTSPGRSPAAARNGLLVLVAALAILLGARTVVRNDDYQSTLSLWTKAAEASPSNHVAYCGVGHALLDLNRPKDALPPLQRSVELNGDYADGFFHLGRALHQLSRFDEAAASFQRVVDFDPDQHEAMYNLGLALQLAERYDESIEVYARLLDETSAYPGAALNMGVALEAIGNHSAAVTALERAIDADPDLTDARYNLAWLLAKLGRYDEAAGEYTKLLEQRPGDVQARMDLAGVLERKGDRVGAVREYRQLLAIQPTNTDAQDAIQRLSQ